MKDKRAKDMKKISDSSPEKDEGGRGLPIGMVIGGVFSAVVAMNAWALSTNPLIYIGIPVGIFSAFCYASWRIDVKQTWEPRWWWD